VASTNRTRNRTGGAGVYSHVHEDKELYCILSWQQKLATHNGEPYLAVTVDICYTHALHTYIHTHTHTYTYIHYIREY
jgi:hypothetical protein